MKSRITVCVAAAAVVLALAAVVTMGTRELSPSKIVVVAAAPEAMAPPPENAVEPDEAAITDCQQSSDPDEFDPRAAARNESYDSRGASRGDPDCACLVWRNGELVIEGR